MGSMDLGWTSRLDFMNPGSVWGLTALVSFTLYQGSPARASCWVFFFLLRSVTTWLEPTAHKELLAHLGFTPKNGCAPAHPVPEAHTGWANAFGVREAAQTRGAPAVTTNRPYDRANSRQSLQLVSSLFPCGCKLFCPCALNASTSLKA